MNFKNSLGKLFAATLIAGASLIPMKSDAQVRIIRDVPAYTWRHGCAPTAFGMVIGYYDTHGMDMIKGDASTQTDEVNQLIASDEHYNAFCIPKDKYDSILPDKSEDAAFMKSYRPNCIADLFKTSYSRYGNGYGTSSGLPKNGVQKVYLEDAITAIFKSRNYPVYSHSNYCYPEDWEDFKASIDAKRPVVLDVNYAEGHMVTAIGYNEKDTTYACHNTWDTLVHWYKWQPSNGKPFSVYAVFYIEPADFDTSKAVLDTVYNKPEVGMPATPQTALNIYPNPIKSNFTIEMPGKHILRIYSTSGQMLYKDKMHDKTMVDEPFKPGMYIIKLEDEKSSITRKIIKK